MSINILGPLASRSWWALASSTGASPLVPSVCFSIAFCIFFLWVFDDYRSPFRFHVLMISMFFASLFRVLLLHQFSKDFETDFGLFSMCFWYLFCLRTQLAKSSKTFVFTMNLHVFTHQKNIFLNVHDICWYLFWHWLLFTLAIDSGLFWNPFYIVSMSSPFFFPFFMISRMIFI